MADTSSKTLRLIFTTEDPTKDFILSLDHPKDTITVATVQPIMAGIITRDAFLAPGGALVGIKGMEIVDRTVDDLLVP
jgi:hypothetical protein